MSKNNKTNTNTPNNTTDNKKLGYTKHCLERYAERIMKREEKTDIATYVAQNKAKIEENIAKLVQYGELVYTGPTTNENITNVYLSGTWVLILDRNGRTVVTLYKIDFGLGEEFNKEFVNKMKEKIDKAKEELDAAKKENEKKIEEYTKEIKYLTFVANDYRKKANETDEQIQNYKKLIDGMRTELNEPKEKYRENVLNLICKKEF